MKISVVIPTHNRLELLRQTLASVTAQTHQDWEAIVVDDHSTDGTRTEMLELAKTEPRLKLLSLSDAHRGAPAARNAGVVASTGDAVIFLDSDDLLSPDCLRHRSLVLEASEKHDFAVFTCRLFRHEPGDVSLLWNDLRAKVIDPFSSPSDEDLDRFLSHDSVWQTTSAIWRKRALDKIGPWDENALGWQDWEFHVRALCAGLKYHKYETIDCHWRLPTDGRGTIGKDSFSIEHARNRLDLILRIGRHLRGVNKLNERRSQMMAGLVFWATDHIAERVSRREARDLWHKAMEEGIVDRFRYYQALPVLMARTEKTRRDLRRRLENRWPKEMVTRRSRTFHATPANNDIVPAISVLMSVHNGAAYLDEAIENIVRQTEPDWELIVVDHASSDRTPKLLAEWALRDARIKPLRFDGPGLSRALNFGLEHCRAALIARHDADDISRHDRFEKQLAHMYAHPHCVALGAQVTLIDPYGVEIGQPGHALEHAEIEKQLLAGVGWAIIQPTVMLRASAVGKVKGYDERMSFGEDLDIHLRMAEIGRLANLPDNLLKYRQHLSSANHKRTPEQIALYHEVVNEAHLRRKLPLPVANQDVSRMPDPQELRRRWAWAALKAGNAPVARRHALALLRSRPFRYEAWLLTACSLRGK